MGVVREREVGGGCNFLLGSSLLRPQLCPSTVARLKFPRSLLYHLVGSGSTATVTRSQFPTDCKNVTASRLQSWRWRRWGHAS